MLDGDSIVKGCIDEGALALIYGASNSGKTFLALDLALSVAAGQTWNGHGVRGGLVAYVAAEAGYRIQRRVRGWLDTRCGEQAEPPLVIVPRVVNLMHDVETGAFADFLTALTSRAWWGKQSRQCEGALPSVLDRIAACGSLQSGPRVASNEGTTCNRPRQQRSPKQIGPQMRGPMRQRCSDLVIVCAARIRVRRDRGLATRAWRVRGRQRQRSHYRSLAHSSPWTNKRGRSQRHN